MDKIIFAAVCTLSLSALASVPVFNVVPNGPLPTSVYGLSSATASYIVTNNSIYTLKGNGLSYPPLGQTPFGVTQVTGGQGFVQILLLYPRVGVVF